MNRRIYIGPSRPYGLPLMNAAILLPGAPVPGLDKAREKHPQLAQLFVPIENLAIARRQVMQNGSPLHRAFEAVQQETLDLRAQQKGGK